MDNLQVKKVQGWLEAPMFLLAIVWLWLLIKELWMGLTPVQDGLMITIWVIFGIEFLLQLSIASDRLKFLKKNFLVAISLVLPAFRAFRFLRILRLGRAAFAPRLFSLSTSSRRLWKASQKAQGIRSMKNMEIGFLIALSPGGDLNGHQQFATKVKDLLCAHLIPTTDVNWHFDIVDPIYINSHEPRKPSQFISEATFHLAEGGYDALFVITDVALTSRLKQVEAGLYSDVSRVAVVSTRQLAATPRGRDSHKVAEEVVTLNGASLMLHMLGHFAGLKHSKQNADGIMKPFQVDEDLKTLPKLSLVEEKVLRRSAQKLPDYEYRQSSFMGSFIFHFLMATRNPKTILKALWRSRAPLLPLSLPSLSTAAVAPSLLLVFTAEIWDVGFGMTNLTAFFFMMASLVGATVYLIKAQSLFFPRRDKTVITEHLAVANSVVFLEIFFAVIGLLLMVMSLMLIIEFWVFPEDLMSTWPTLDVETITAIDRVRLAVFIATVGVATGALAGGLDNRDVIQHMALFEDEP